MSAVRVLLIDDERLVLSSLRRLLARADFDVLACLSGAEGLALLEKEEVDVIISDYQMPGMTGIEFLEQVAPRWPKIRRCMLTAQADKKLLEASLENGLLDRAFSKPWDNQQLVKDLLSVVASAGGAASGA